jgi:hypothetical protein
VDELTVRRMLKESKQELNIIQAKYKVNPSKQLRVDLNFKVIEVGLLNVKLKNIKSRGTYH